MYRLFKSSQDWKKFKRIIKRTKHTFFDNKIQKIALKNKRSWNLMSWIRKCKLLAIETIQFNEYPYIELNNLWHTLHQTFNSAQNQNINVQLLNKIFLKPCFKWLLS